MIVLKEEFVGGEKWRRAVKLGGSDSIVMWLALKCYASQHPTTEGFVPDENIDDLPGAPRKPRKALEALTECGRLLPDGTRGAGLVDVAHGGWQLHDYLDHSQTPEEIELRREKARLKKARQRADKRRELEEVRTESVTIAVYAGTRGGTARDMSPQTDVSDPGTHLAGARPPVPAPARTPEHAGARSQPSPTVSNPVSLPEERENSAPHESQPPPSSGERWRSYPRGWREWSLDTAKEAVAQGLTTADLAGHVDYWSLRDFPGGAVNDLDGELRRSIPGIVERKRKASDGSAGPPPATSGSPYDWAPTAEHRAFVAARASSLPGNALQIAARAYRATGIPDKIGTLAANDDFMRRLRWWADNGGDFPLGKRLSEARHLPRRIEAELDQLTAVGGT